MKQIIILLLISLIHSAAPAQQFRSALDSLSAVIDAREAHDTATIDLRNQYTRQALFANPADTTLLDFTGKTVGLAKEMGYWFGLQSAYERMALIYQYSYSNPYKALEYYHLALDILENEGLMDRGGWSIYGGIGTIYYEQEEYDKALTYFQQVLENDKSLELTATANIANIYGSKNRYDSAIYYYRRALNMEQVKNNPTYLANLYSNLSLVYSQAGRMDSSLVAAERSIGLINEYGIEFVRPTAYANAAMAYLGNNDYDQAEFYARQSLILSENQGNLFLQKSAWGTLADVFTANGQMSEALEAFKMFALLKDSLNGQNRRVEISRQQMEFDFERERTTARAALDRQETMKQLYMTGGGGLLLVAVFGFVLYKRRRDAVALKKEAEFRALVSDTELKALRAQMNPHFVFNSLNSIGDYILKNDNDTAIDYLTKFARLMRLVLENSEFTEIPLAEDLKFLELYLQVETRRQPGKFIYSIRVADDIDAENTLIPPLILQPFIENSIWHGIQPESGPGHIKIRIDVISQRLVCRVEDDGAGFDLIRVGNKSFGISITESRLEILNRQYHAESRLKIGRNEQGRGTCVEINLPLNLKF